MPPTLHSQSVFLIGPRAAGKTVLGRRLAELWGWPFVDADALLEERHGRRIADWLPQDEPGFRQAEAELLEELLDRDGCVVALGGGVVERAESVARLAAEPRVLALLATAEELARRQAGAGRPPLSELPLLDEVRQVLARRSAAYAQAAGGRVVRTDGSLEQAWGRLRVAALHLRAGER